MNIAMPIFGNRVSPRFDCAQSFLVVTAKGQKIVARRELFATHWTPHERISQLVTMGIDVVVCGGIDSWSSAALRDAGINVYGRVTGPADESLDAFLQGKLAMQEIPGQTEARDSSARNPTRCGAAHDRSRNDGSAHLGHEATGGRPYRGNYRQPSARKR
jgi:predicted Fe-Mo cluster-binding NifX family protein